MKKIEELMEMRWGISGYSLVCTGEHGEGVVMADCYGGFFMSKDDATEIARHIVAIHNECLAAREEAKERYDGN